MSDPSSDSWCTPYEVSLPLVQFFGGPVGCDPCSNDRSIIKSDRRYVAGGLHQPWGGWKMAGGKIARTAYKNPPYSKTALWTEKGILELEGGLTDRHGNINELVDLVMASTSTAWWGRGMRDTKRNPRVIFTKRLAFIDPRPRKVRGEDKRGLKTASARFEPALIYYGSRIRAFEREFATITSWLSWGR